MTGSLKADTRGCQIFVCYGGAETACNRSRSSQTLWQDLCCDHARANKADWIWWKTEEERRAEQKEEEGEEAVLAKEEEGFSSWSHFKSTVFRRVCTDTTTQIWTCLSRVINVGPPASSGVTLWVCLYFSWSFMFQWFIKSPELIRWQWSSSHSSQRSPPPRQTKGGEKMGGREGCRIMKTSLYGRRSWSNQWGNEACDCPVVWTHLHIPFNAAQTLINQPRNLLPVQRRKKPILSPVVSYFTPKCKIIKYLFQVELLTSKPWGS